MPSRTLDYFSLGFASFFLGDILEGSNANPSLLWLYFTSTPMRAILYSGFALKLSINYLTGQESRPKALFAIGLFAGSAYFNFPKLYLDPNEKTDYGSWRQSATEGLGWMGSWWIGGGNGEWFGFFGHNGSDEKTILPASLLEQMSVKKETKSEDGIIVMEELDSDD